MPMFLLRRLMTTLPNILGVLLVTFVIARLLPGDPAAYFAGPAADNEAIEQMRRAMNLDKPIPQQLMLYLRELASGDLGTSLVTGNPVADDIMRRLPASLELAGLAMIAAVAVGVPLGILAALWTRRWPDHLFRGVMTVTASMPTFFVALLLLFVFYHQLGIAPSPVGRLPIFAFPPEEITGFLLIDTALAGDWSTFATALAHLILPALSLALFALAPIARLCRSLMLESLASDYVAAASAHGLSQGTVVLRYAFRNTLMSLLNIFGMVFSFLVGATVLVERVYGWPGIGSYAVEAVLSADYAAVQGFILAVATLYILVNTLIDLAAGAADPRVRATA